MLFIPISAFYMNAQKINIISSCLPETEMFFILMIYNMMLIEEDQ